jgi:hypothetical protein
MNSYRFKSKLINAKFVVIGLWDNNKSLNNELFVLDKDGINEFLTNLNDVRKARNFWR